MTKAEYQAYRQGRAAHKRGEPKPIANASNALGWSYFLGWLNASLLAQHNAEIATALEWNT